jgi:hypothetical protein
MKHFFTPAPCAPTALAATAWVTTALCISTLAFAHDSDRGDDDSSRPITVAAFGDWPYSQTLLDNGHLLTNSVNADPDVSLVIHVGDIHSGSMPCTGAGYLPPISTSNPGWNQSIFYQFEQFNDPVVYTPGDNEWADCHKSKQFSSGAPLRELASVRQLFFARPGVSLGKHVKKVQSQAEHFDAAFPTDSQFVENVMWHESRIMFATFNIPGGSNDDTSPWTGIFADPSAQAAEAVDRRGANLRWLQRTFDTAREEHAKAIVIVLQANMWDPEAIAAGGAGLDKYTPFVQLLANLTLSFGRPVLLLNGDTHLFATDHPLADPTSTTGVIHHTQSVPNLTRITVQGSTNAPAEWLRITIDPRTSQVFSWVNVPYCANPATASCQ